MASRPFRTLLALCCASMIGVLLCAPVLAQTEVIKPELDRRDIDYKRIDNEFIEFTPYVGMLAIEDFDTSSLSGVRIGVHLNEYLFVEASYGEAEGDRTSYEELSGSAASIFSDSDREYTFWDVSLGLNLFTGESWLLGKAFSSNFYLLFGAGTTEFGDDDWTTLNAGVGYRLFLTDWLALRLDVRDHIFNRDVFIENDQTHNIELSGAFSIFF